MKKVGLLGGTFNPIHIGHLRLALELAENLQVERFELIPSAEPPHKESHGILDFDLRCKMIQATITELPPLVLNPCEGQRQGPSYTVDTLLELNLQHLDTYYFFVIGCEDFALLPTWFLATALPFLGHFIVVSRDTSDYEKYKDIIHTLWIDVQECSEDCKTIFKNNAGKYAQYKILDSLDICFSKNNSMLQEKERYEKAMQLVALKPYYGVVSYMSVTRLDIRATELRKKWLQGLDTRILLPEKATLLLTEHDRAVRDTWQ